MLLYSTDKSLDLDKINKAEKSKKEKVEAALKLHVTYSFEEIESHLLSASIAHGYTNEVLRNVEDALIDNNVQHKKKVKIGKAIVDILVAGGIAIICAINAESFTINNKVHQLLINNKINHVIVITPRNFTYPAEIQGKYVSVIKPEGSRWI